MKLLSIFSDFFNTKPAFRENAPYLFSTQHIIFIVFCLITIPLLAILLRKLDHKKIKIYLIVYWAITTLLEIIKIIWDTYAENGGVINMQGILPLYLCSIPMYIMPFVIWGKGRVKQCATGFMCTFALLGGIANTVYASILNWYPALTSFAGAHSMFYHYFMILTAVLLWTSKYYKPTFLDSVWSFVPLAIFSVPVIILDKTLGWDYMFYNGGGFPFTIISSHMPSWLWTIVLFIGYFLINMLIFYVPVWIAQTVKKRKTRAETQSLENPINQNE